MAAQSPFSAGRSLGIFLGVAVVAAGIGLLSRELSGSPWIALCVQLATLAGGYLIAVRTGAAARSARAKMHAQLRSIADGRPLDRGDAEQVDELVARLDARMSHARRQITELSGRLTDLPAQVADAMKQVERSADDQEAAVEETASLLANINTSIRDINTEVENLARSNEETAASIQQMGTAIEQVAQSSHALQGTVESSTASIHEMGASIQRVAESSDDVQQVAEETATATTEMDRAIQEVGDHVRGATALTEKVSESADEGSMAVMATIQGIATIRDQTLGAKSALEGLAERIGEIGQIATVIGSVSDETNLLSLNAAIIAAQAGEHGKAFAVVADQVKTLAQRTSTSAKQIEEMIRGVQGESANAVRRMAAGIESVEEGVSRSRVAGEALEAIRTAARDASGQVGEIARAADEQARNSKHVADAANRVSQVVQQISGAMGEQSTASQNLLRNADTSLDMCRQMARALEEQRTTGRYITGNSESITGMIRSIQRNTESHERSSAAVAGRFDSLLEIAQRSASTIPEVARAVNDVAHAAAQARRELEPDAPEPGAGTSGTD